MFSTPEQRRDWAQRALLGAVLTQRNRVHFQGYPGLLWCNFPSSGLFPVKNFPEETYTHSIENWDPVLTALPQHHVGMWMRSLLRSSCRGEASLKPNSVICNHLSKPLSFFYRTFPVFSHLSLCGSLQCWLCCVQGQVLPLSAFYCTSAHWV